MKRLSFIYLTLALSCLLANANTLLWGSDTNTVSDEFGNLVPTSKTNGTIGAFAQLIWVGLDGNVDDFLYSGTGVSDDDQVLAVNYSYGRDYLFGDNDGKFFDAPSGLSEDSQVYVRVYNAANPNYANGTNAVITGSDISHYWQSSVYSFDYIELGTDDLWNFTGGTDVQTTTAVPEPTTFFLFAMGGMGAWVIRRKNRLMTEKTK